MPYVPCSAPLMRAQMLGLLCARFGAVVGVVAAAMRNPAHEGLSLGAVHASEALARRLAHAGPEVIF